MLSGHGHAGSKLRHQVNLGFGVGTSGAEDAMTTLLPVANEATTKLIEWNDLNIEGLHVWWGRRTLERWRWCRNMVSIRRRQM